MFHVKQATQGPSTERDELVEQGLSEFVNRKGNYRLDCTMHPEGKASKEVGDTAA
jgi:hypothetical protein